VFGKFFIKTSFFSLPGEVFLRKKEKKSFYEKFAGRQQYQCFIIHIHDQITKMYVILRPASFRVD
jgi:hypothetical protein